MINLHHKLLKPEKLFWPSSLSGAAQLDHCFQVKGLRKEVNEGDGLDSIAGSDERAQITSQRGGVARDADQRRSGDLCQQRAYLRAQAGARRVHDNQIGSSRALGAMARVNLKEVEGLVARWKPGRGAPSAQRVA